MAGTRYIRLHDGDPDEVSWLTRTPATPQADARSGTLQQAAVGASACRVVVFVPTCAVLLTDVDMPTRNRQQLRSAVPFAVENLLIDDVEAMHFAVAGQDEDGRLAVAAVAHEQMEHWLAALEQAGLRPNAIYPDLFGLPLRAGHWTLLSDGGMTQVRTGPHAGFAIESDNLPGLIDRCLTEHSDRPPAGLDLFDCTPDAAALSVDSGRTPPLARHDCATGPLQILVDGLDERHAIDLLQGDYRSSAKLVRHLRPWWPAATLALVALLLVGIAAALDHAATTRHSEALDAQIEQLFRDSFPDVKRIVDPVVQMRQQLATLRRSAPGNSGFVQLIGRLAQPLSQTAGVQIASARYQDDGIDLQLTIGDLAGLEQLQQRLRAQQLDVEIRSATARERRVSAHLHLTPVQQ